MSIGPIRPQDPNAGASNVSGNNFPGGAQLAKKLNSLDMPTHTANAASMKDHTATLGGRPVGMSVRMPPSQSSASCSNWSFKRV